MDYGPAPSPPLSGDPLGYPRGMLDDLHTLIETLQVRISEHGPALSQSEALTRYALIDPLLRGLGWDTGDPTQVIPEFRSTSGSADYALLNDKGQPIIIVEAKKLGTPVLNAVPQVIGYCIHEGYEYFAVTDGAIWELYETNRPGPLPGKQVIALDLRGPLAQTCLDALALWRPAVSTGIVQSGAESPLTATAAPVHHATTPAIQGPTDSSLRADGWYRLSDVSPQPGTHPCAIRFPTGEEVEALYWGSFNEALVRWLSRHGHLTNEKLPILNANGKTVLTLKADPPMRPSGQKVKTLRSFDQFLLNSTFPGSANITHVRLIIETAGQDPADFAIRME